MIFGNWKMNTRREEAISLAHAIVQIAEKSTTQIGICPPSIWLDAVSRVTSESTVLLGGQDCIGDSLGSHTGCLNVELFDDIGIQAVILGHSERRARFGETTEKVTPAVIQALNKGMIPILCVGETLIQRKNGKAESIVAEQLKPLLTAGIDLSKIVIAYEPVWAIGSGRVATSMDIDHMHQLIRNVLERDDAVVLYGGSVSPDTAADVFSSKAVSGALVGNASLDAKKFAAIVAAWEIK